MKIQSISNFKFNPIQKNNLNKQYISNKTNSDSISFKGKVLTYDELRPLRLRAWQVQNDSIEHKKDAEFAKNEGYEKLGVAKNEFLQALKYCNYYKKHPSKTSLELQNGNTLKFQFEFKRGNLTFEIEEVNEQDEVIKTTSAVNFIPTKVIDFSGEEISVYEYSGNKVAILENLGIDGDEFGSCDKFYSFTNGKISNISIKGNVSKTPSEFEKTYIYFDDKLTVCSLGNTIYQNGSCYADERFVYIDESFSNYYSGFNGNKLGGMSFDESIHFKKGSLIGSINQGIQQARNQDIISSDAIFLNDEKQFIHTSKLRARVSDFGLPIFADCE